MDQADLLWQIRAVRAAYAPLLRGRPLPTEAEPAADEEVARLLALLEHDPDGILGHVLGESKRRVVRDPARWDAELERFLATGRPILKEMLREAGVSKGELDTVCLAGALEEGRPKELIGSSADLCRTLESLHERARTWLRALRALSREERREAELILRDAITRLFVGTAALVVATALPKDVTCWYVLGARAIDRAVGELVKEPVG